MSRVYNFSAGPAVLPEPVLKKAASEMLEYGETGMSVMEMSHRSGEYRSIQKGAENLLRKLMNIPENYSVLFLQGGASLQFSMIPMNIMTINKKIDVIHTGSWTGKAIKEAEKFGQVRVLASSEEKTFTYIPDMDSIKVSPDADYLHICYNNTIYGTKYSRLPETGGVPVVCDMSSCILSEPFNVSDFGIIFAGAQKNIGPAGVTIVIIRNDLMSRAGGDLPTMLDFRTHAESDSLFNTPPTYPVYIAKLVFEWLDSMGGVDEIHSRNREKASLLYDFLDESDMFRGNVDKAARSLMNVTFTTGSKELDAKFIKEAEGNGLVSLGGHKTAGGMRASIYNAMPFEGVNALTEFMKKFESANI